MKLQRSLKVSHPDEACLSAILYICIFTQCLLAFDNQQEIKAHPPHSSRVSGWARVNRVNVKVPEASFGDTAWRLGQLGDDEVSSSMGNSSELTKALSAWSLSYLVNANDRHRQLRTHHHASLTLSLIEIQASKIKGRFSHQILMEQALWNNARGGGWMKHEMKHEITPGETPFSR